MRHEGGEGGGGRIPGGGFHRPIPGNGGNGENNIAARESGSGKRPDGRTARPAQPAASAGSPGRRDSEPPSSPSSGPAAEVKPGSERPVPPRFAAHLADEPEQRGADKGKSTHSAQPADGTAEDQEAMEHAVQPRPAGAEGQRSGTGEQRSADAQPTRDDGPAEEPADGAQEDRQRSGTRAPQDAERAEGQPDGNRHAAVSEQDDPEKPLTPPRIISSGPVEDGTPADAPPRAGRSTPVPPEEELDYIDPITHDIVDPYSLQDGAHASDTGSEPTTPGDGQLAFSSGESEDAAALRQEAIGIADAMEKLGITKQVLDFMLFLAQSEQDIKETLAGLETKRQGTASGDLHQPDVAEEPGVPDAEDTKEDGEGPDQVNAGAPVGPREPAEATTPADPGENITDGPPAEQQPADADEGQATEETADDTKSERSRRSPGEFLRDGLRRSGRLFGIHPESQESGPELAPEHDGGAEVPREIPEGANVPPERGSATHATIFQYQELQPSRVKDAVAPATDKAKDIGYWLADILQQHRNPLTQFEVEELKRKIDGSYGSYKDLVELRGLLENPRPLGITGSALTAGGLAMYAAENLPKGVNGFVDLLIIAGGAVGLYASARVNMLHDIFGKGDRHVPMAHNGGVIAAGAVGMGESIQHFPWPLSPGQMALIGGSSWALSFGQYITGHVRVAHGKSLRRKEKANSNHEEKYVLEMVGDRRKSHGTLNDALNKHTAEHAKIQARLETAKAKYNNMIMDPADAAELGERIREYQEALQVHTIEMARLNRMVQRRGRRGRLAPALTSGETREKYDEYDEDIEARRPAHVPPGGTDGDMPDSL